MDVTLGLLMSGRNTEFDAAVKDKKVKMVRLSDDDGGKGLKIGGNPLGMNLHRLYATDQKKFKEYMSEWDNESGYKFVKDCEYLVVLAAEATVDARFLKVFKVKDHIDTGRKIVIEEVLGFSGIEGKVVVKWGETASSTQAWKQLWKDREVVAMDKGIIFPPMEFTSYTDVVLSFSELEDIITNEYPEWKLRMDKVNCIYCIADKSNGMLYIGSTYSKGGLWNRWGNYVATKGTGGNKMLEDLTPEYRRKNLQWSILEILDHKIIDKDAVEREKFYKKKFCTQTGYNLN